MSKTRRAFLGALGKFAILAPLAVRLAPVVTRPRSMDDILLEAAVHLRSMEPPTRYDLGGALAMIPADETEAFIQASRAGLERSLGIPERLIESRVEGVRERLQGRLGV